MTDPELLDLFAGLTVWKQGSARAPHKPLLALYALARFASGEERLLFTTVEEPLKQLLIDFGPHRATYHPQYPFWRLQTDGVWTLSETDGLVQRQSNSDPTLTSLRAVDPFGAFPEDVAAAFRQRPALIGRVAQALLDSHFPPTLHESILGAVGLDLDGLGARGSRTRRRDPRFREAVLRAYGYRCAVCGFETRIGRTLVGIDAAHVKWHQAGGADDVPNGLALCALHHRLLDSGAFTLASAGSHEIVVAVAEGAHGGGGFERWLLHYHGRPLARPVRASFRVAEPSIAWHRREVFRTPARA